MERNSQTIVTFLKNSIAVESEKRPLQN